MTAVLLIFLEMSQIYKYVTHNVITRFICIKSLCNWNIPFVFERKYIAGQLSYKNQDRRPTIYTPDSKMHGTNIGPTWVLSATAGPHVGPMNLCYQGRFFLYPVVMCKYIRLSVTGDGFAACVSSTSRDMWEMVNANISVWAFLTYDARRMNNDIRVN